MMGNRNCCIVGFTLVTVFCLVVGQAARGDEKPASSTIAFGVPGSFLKNLPPSLAKALTGPLKKLLELQTGFGIDLVVGDDHEALGQMLDDGKAQLAVMHGFEYAWLRDKHPKLKPLVVAVGEPRQIRAYLLTQADSKAKCIGDLAGSSLVVPPIWKYHCRLFLDRQCREVGHKPDEHFTQTKTTEELEQALDAVAYGRAGAMVADEEAVDWYKQRRPSRFAKLKIVAESEVFPATVLVYHEGTLPEATLRRLRESLVASGRGAEVKILLSVCHFAAFEPVPKDYDQDLTAILKAYPPPN